jgi:molybdenum cofactor synthesis domain-containing protein
MPAAANPTAAILIVGNEILSGRTSDVNVAHIAQALGGIGVVVREVRVVPDVEAEIIAAVNALRTRYTYVFSTGGIGPTHDDITSASMARAFGVALILHPEARARLERRYEHGGLNEARLRMAYVPDGAELIDNPVSAAPGFRIGNVYVMAGVPVIMQAMLAGLLPTLRGGAPVRSRAVSCALAEGVIAADLGALQDRFPDLDVGSYPYFRAGSHGVSLVLRGFDEALLDRAAAELEDLVRRHGGTPVLTRGDEA